MTVISTPLCLQNALADLGWTGADLARRLGVHPNTVSAWTTGQREIPRYAGEYLRVALLARAILDGA